MKQAATGSGAGASKRTSTRKAVVSKAMRVVDSETRRVVHDKRLAALEADNYMEELGRISDEEDDAYETNISEELKPKKKRAKIMKNNISKWLLKKTIPLERIVAECQYDPEKPVHGQSNYVTVNASSSYLPARKFCSVCGCFASYSCTRCGMRLCTVRCGNNHKETSCLKFSF